MTPLVKLSSRRGAHGLTLIEFVVCVVVIGLLVSFVSPKSGRLRPTPEMLKYRQAQVEVRLLQAAIADYQRIYTNALPVTEEVMLAAKPDFTFGPYESNTVSASDLKEPWNQPLQRNNAQVMAILLAQDHAEFNPAHRYNPMRKQFFDSSQAQTKGLSLPSTESLVYRDPWGMPYIISFDLGNDGWTQDHLYSLNRVSFLKLNQEAGRLHLFTRSGQFKDDFALQRRVMIWSLGPDRQADPNLPANQGVNADNVLSWR